MTAPKRVRPPVVEPAPDPLEAAKDYAEPMMVAEAMAAYTWADLDAQHAVMEQTEEIQELTCQYNCIVQSIVGAMEMAPEERARLLTEAATGYSDRVAASRTDTADAKAQKPSLFQRIFAPKAAAPPWTKPARDGSVVLLAGKAGGYDRFALWASNNFKDRTGEIFPAAAIEAAVDRFNAREGAKGAANIWHVGHPEYGWRGYPPNLSDWGEIEHAAYVDGFLFVEGKVTNQAVAAGIKAWGEREPLGTSIEYTYRESDKAGGVYSNFDFDRVSVVPRKYAANPWGPDTMVTMGKGGSDMPFQDPKIREAIVTLWSEETAHEWETAAATKSAELTAGGVAAKAISVSVDTPPVVKFTFAAKDDSAVDATPAVDEASAVVATEADPPQWAKDLAAQNATIIAQLAEDREAVKAVKAELAGASPAVSILGRSVQTSGVLERATSEIAEQDALAAAYKADGRLPDPAMLDMTKEWGIAGQIAAAMVGGTNGAAKPAGS